MKISKKDMILLTILEMSNKSKKILAYEDILIKTFHRYPDVFHLKGYKKYPDTVILMRELYNLVPAGLIRIKKRKCILTDLGLSRAIKILPNENNLLKVTKTQGEFNTLYKSVLSLTDLEGFKLFKERKFEKILDVDFYEFFNTSVRTSKIDLQSNIKRVTDLLKEYSTYDKVLTSELENYNKFLIKSFKDLSHN